MDKHIEEDTYNIERIKLTEAEIRLHLLEVDNHCPLCGKILQSNRQKKPNQKLFEIAHIYPNSPTKQQKETLEGVERLGKNCEDFENKIALCIECHKTQDFRTTKEDYNKLLNIKKEYIKKTSIELEIDNLTLEEEIYKIIFKLSEIQESDMTELNYESINIDKKFCKDETIIKRKIRDYIREYFIFIKNLFKELENDSNYDFEIACCNIKTSFLKVSRIEKDKSKIFNSMVNWIKQKTQTECIEACEAIVSFFVQNCEVFKENEATK